MKVLKHLSFSSLRKKASEFFEAVPDGRQQSKVSISIHDALMSGLVRHQHSILW